MRVEQALREQPGVVEIDIDERPGLPRVELDLDGANKYAIQLQGHELPRARGGPRCLTMPLARDRV